MASVRAYIAVWGQIPAGVPVRVRGTKPPEAESSVAFEAPAEEPNLTLVTHLFLQFI